MKIVQITTKEQFTDKNDKVYFTIGLSQNVTAEIDGQEVFLPGRNTKIRAYQESYLNGQPEFGALLDVGAFMAGEIITREVPPYLIQKRDKDGDLLDEFITVATRTLFVPGDTSDSSFDLMIDKVFARHHAGMVKRVKNGDENIFATEEDVVNAVDQGFIMPEAGQRMLENVFTLGVAV